MLAYVLSSSGGVGRFSTDANTGCLVTAAAMVQSPAMCRVPLPYLACQDLKDMFRETQDRPKDATTGVVVFPPLDWPYSI